MPLNLSRSITHQLIYLEGERTIEERGIVQSLLKPGMTAVDVGANIGYYALMLRNAVGEQGQVICFEPERENVEELEKVVKTNAFSNVKVYPAAVGAKKSTVGLQARLNSAVTGEQSEGSYEVEQLTLNDLAERPVDFLKIDIEGYEWEALQGAGELLEKDRPHLFLEFHPRLVKRYGASFDQVIEFLKPFYPKPSYYRMERKKGLLTKVARNYFNREPIIHMDEAAARDCDDTFWIIGQK